MAIHYVAAEHGEMIKKIKNNNKERSWVKLKAFPSNVGRPSLIKNDVNRKVSRYTPCGLMEKPI